ncbi:MAG TPA: acetyl-CoA C-acyltransferase [Candidatus Nitrosotenuis sp.]|jgi:acetyl-CoA acyltransferase|nr:acetyl-CoA C-acyltransferase [Candidatus Nitrosotenuis sp.]
MPTPRKGADGARRVAIIDGLRTPFARAYTVYQNLTATDLARACVRELLERTELDPKEVDEVIFGCVLPPVGAPNIAREVVLGLDLPRHIPGFTLTRACASSAQALITAAEGILCGEYEVVIVGGTESLSNVPVPYSKNLIDALQQFNRAKSLRARLAALSRLRPEDLVPHPPDIAETATGKTMGQHAEMMAKIYGISREEQDRLALESHRRAAEAAERNRDELCTVWAPPQFTPVEADNTVRRDTSMEKLAQLAPVFDRRYGTITAGNSSGLTDGAAALLVMSEQKARQLGYEPLCYVRSWASTAIDPTSSEPGEQLLLGPAHAIPEALDKAGLKLAEVDLVDLHEAFAAQVLCVLRALESADFAREKLGRDEPVGRVDPEKLNVCGGSIALGHPFGATGARQASTMAHELVRRQARTAVISQCAAGGMGTAIVLER